MLRPRVRWLLASSWVTNLGGGIATAAGPLVVASLTRSPALLARAATLQGLPALIFRLFAGARTDRLDRRLIVVTGDALRAVVRTVLAFAVATRRVSFGTLMRIGLIVETFTYLTLTARARVALPVPLSCSARTRSSGGRRRSRSASERFLPS